MKHKWLIIIMGALMVLMLLMFVPVRLSSGDTAPAEREDLIVVGFSQVGAESDWRVANSESMKTTFTRANGYELIYDDARQKQENQFKAIRTFIQQEVDYIVLAPVTETGWESVLEEAREVGIPVVVMDRQVDVEDQNLYTSWVGSDFRREADVAMKWLEEELDRRGVAEEPVEILHLQGTGGATAQIHRTAGLWDAVDRHSNWHVAATLQGDFTEAKAYEVTAAYLAKNQKVNVIYCENDNMAFGVMDALDDAGISYGADGDVILVSFDAGRSALEACLAGKLNLSVECNPLLGPRVEEIIRQLEAGETPPKASHVEESFFTWDTVTQSLLDARPY